MLIKIVCRLKITAQKLCFFPFDLVAWKVVSSEFVFSNLHMSLARTYTRFEYIEVVGHVHKCGTEKNEDAAKQVIFN